MNKKAGAIVVYMIALAIGVALIAFIFFGFVWTICRGAVQLGAQIDILGDPACKTQGQILKGQGKTVQDDDNDLRPDLNCDICIPGDNDKDNDADGVPDDCDADPNDPKIGFCTDSEKKDCSKALCCEEGKNQCGPEETGEIKNIGTIKKPKYQCVIS